MKTSIISKLTCTVLILGLLAACRGSSPTVTPGLSEENVAATIEAGVQATHTAATALAATIDTSMHATNTAQATISPPAQTPTPPPAQTPTPPPAVDSASMTEEELAAAIDAAVVEALASSEQANAAVAQAANDDVITVEETITIQVELANAEQAIALAETLIVTYADVYGEYAAEALAVLIEIEQDLQIIAENTAAILALLEQGSEAATAAIAQIEAALADANAQIAAIQAQSQGWLQSIQAEIEARAGKALATEANTIAANRQESIQSARQYIDTVRLALNDQRISQQELASIAQAGANASASLKAQGGPQLQGLAGSIDALTAQLAQGQWNQAQTNLSALESSLPGRP